MSAHRHALDRVAVLEPPAVDQRVLHLACACGHVDPEPICGHEWERPGRALAHGRAVRCSGCDLELRELLHACPRHGDLAPHRLRVRARGGLALVCRACSAESAKTRTIPVKVSRAAALRYYHAYGAHRRQESTS